MNLAAIGRNALWAANEIENLKNPDKVLWESHYSKRLPAIHGLQSVIARHIRYAESEMQRKIESGDRARQIRANAVDSPAWDEWRFLINATGEIPGVMFSETDLFSGMWPAIEAQYPSIFEDAGTQLFHELAPDYPAPDTELPADLITHFIAQRKNLIRGASQEIFDEVRDAYLKARNENLAREQLVDRIGDVFEDMADSRARLIASTETGVAYGQARHAGMKQAGVAHHKWLCSFDNSRQWHIEANDQRRPIGEPFIVKGEKMMHPGDPNGSAANVCNCHCIELAA